jgi:hypothetical protein
VQERTMFDDPVSDSNIVVLITEHQKAMVMNELHKLFVFHGKRVTEDERGMFAADLCTANIPYKALLDGIRELQSAKGRESTELWAIKEACQHAAAENFKATENCDACGGTGVIMMIRKSGQFRGYVGGFACVCDNGKRHVHTPPRLPRWNGLDAQTMMDRRKGEPVDFVLCPRNGPRPAID